jgi:carboxylesterase type B
MTTVMTHCGQVQGKKVSSSLGSSYSSFTGIPYMKPPVGSLRFRDPQPMEPWQGVLDCTKAIESYCNYDQKIVLKIGKEDAAILNVYVPDRETNQILPVLVNIHGGNKIIITR